MIEIKKRQHHNGKLMNNNPSVDESAMNPSKPASESDNPSANSKKYERNTFLFLTVLLAPILSVFIVGGFGFIVWISQLLFGPPGS
ncbi:MAG: nitrate reductase NapE [Phenylobacterium sp.]